MLFWRFAGLVLAPMDFAAEEAKGLVFVPSMGLGVLITAPLVTLALIALRQAPMQLYTRAAALPGILAGVIWNSGNVRFCCALPRICCACTVRL